MMCSVPLGDAGGIVLFDPTAEPQQRVVERQHRTAMPEIDGEQTIHELEDGTFEHQEPAIHVPLADGKARIGDHPASPGPRRDLDAKHRLRRSDDESLGPIGEPERQGAVGHVLAQHHLDDPLDQTWSR